MTLSDQIARACYFLRRQKWSYHKIAHFTDIPLAEIASVIERGHRLYVDELWKLSDQQMSEVRAAKKRSTKWN